MRFQKVVAYEGFGYSPVLWVGGNCWGSAFFASHKPKNIGDGFRSRAAIEVGLRFCRWKVCRLTRREWAEEAAGLY